MRSIWPERKTRSRDPSHRVAVRAPAPQLVMEVTVQESGDGHSLKCESARVRSGSLQPFKSFRRKCSQIDIFRSGIYAHHLELLSTPKVGPSGRTLPGHHSPSTSRPVVKMCSAIIRCTADPAKADKRTRSKWSRVMRYAAVYKPDSEPLYQFITRLTARPQIFETPQRRNHLLTDLVAHRHARPRSCGENTWRLRMLVRTWSRDSSKIFKQIPTKTWHYIFVPATPRPQQNQWVMSRAQARGVTQADLSNCRASPGVSIRPTEWSGTRAASWASMGYPSTNCDARPNPFTTASSRA
jgi:hypothetical protein